MSKARKRWISAEVDAGLVAQLEREAQARGISRSEAVRRALRDWTVEAMEEDERRITRAEVNHRKVMARLDFVVGVLREQDRTMERIVRSAPEPVAATEAETNGGALAEARKRARRRF